MALKALKNANLALAFFLELVALVAFGYWGFHTGQGTLVKVGLGIGVPLVAIVVWAIFGAPRSKRRLQGFGLLALRIIFFGLAAVALFAASQQILGVIFGLIVAVNFALIYAWAQ